MELRRQMLVLCALIVAALPMWVALAEEKPKEPKRLTLTGQIVPIADLVKDIGSRLDPDAVSLWLALVTKDGKIYPLIKDSGSRMFYKDKALLKRPMRIVGRVLPGSQLLQVLEFHGLKQGKLIEIYYWCDICSIRRYEKNLCECCGGPMEKMEVPVKE